GCTARRTEAFTSTTARACGERRRLAKGRRRRGSGQQLRRINRCDRNAVENEGNLVSRSEVLLLSVSGLAGGDRRRADLDSSVNESDDPVTRDFGAGVDARLFVTIAVKAAFGDLDEQSDVGGTGMTRQIGAFVPANDGDVRLRFALAEGDGGFDAGL